MKTILLALLLCLISFQSRAMCVNEEPRAVTTLPYWSDAGPGISSAQFFRDESCVVHFSGAVYRWGDPGITVGVSIPAGYEPRKFEYFTVVAMTYFHGIQVAVVIARPRSACDFCLGTLEFYVPDDTAWVSMSGVSYKSAAQ